MIDAEGYVTLTGRLKEIINRGGEKISPREVDEALMDHPAVLQVVTFAVPHDKLGEDVAAAVVLREGMSASEAGIARFPLRAHRAVQDAAQDPVSGRNPEGRHWQAAAHRARRRSSGWRKAAKYIFFFFFLGGKFNSPAAAPGRSTTRSEFPGRGR